MVHDGAYADAGHYYAFIYDHHRGVWFRYNDYLVSEEVEDVVLCESFGGMDKSSAYAVVYVSGNHLKELKNPPNKLQQLPEKFKREVELDNSKYLQELSTFKASKIARDIFDRYKSRLNSLCQYQQPGQFV